MRFTVLVNSTGRFPVIELKDTLTNTRAEIYGFGALLNALSLTVNGKELNVIDGFSSVEEAFLNITRGFKSAKLAPFVCRMKNGKYSFEGKEYTLEKFYLEEHAIHGILYDAPFELMNTHADDHCATAGLRYQYQATDKGYPFAFEILVNWKLESENKLSVKTTVFHHNEKVIPFADGWHPYFTLGNSVDGYTLQFDSDTQIEFDETLVPTGKMIKDERFTDGILLKNISLDNCFRLKQPGSSSCSLKNDSIELIIRPGTSYPYLQIYIPPHRNSIAIENLSAVPDTFNNGMGLLLLEHGYHAGFTTTYILRTL